jgi:hypothetical protein
MLDHAPPGRRLMSPMILVYMLLLALVVGGLFVATITYRAKRRGQDTTHIPRATQARPGDRPPRSLR